MNKPLFKKAIPYFLLIICILTTCCCLSAADAKEINPDNIYEMNLSELMELEVVTATGTKMKLRETPSAVYIISEKDIHRAHASINPL